MATIIPASEIKPLYTTLFAAKYNEFTKIRATGFLRSMFKDLVTKVLYPSYNVRRGTEKIAPNVMLGSQGRRTELTKSTQKLLDLFYFRLYFGTTGMDAYWNLFGSEAPTMNMMIDFVDSIMENYKVNQDQIERAYEYMCAQILINGTCSNPYYPDNIIDFGRRAESMVNPGAGNYWDVEGVDPYEQLAAGGTFIRQYGKYMGGVFNVIMGEKAFNDFLNNSVVKQRNDLKMWKLDELVQPEMRVDGQVYKGTITAGSYVMHVWTYPQFYENPSGELVPYIDENVAIVVPPSPDFALIYGACPQLVSPTTNTPQLISAPYVFTDYIDQLGREHRFDIESRGMPVPIAVDTIYTLTTGA